MWFLLKRAPSIGSDGSVCRFMACMLDPHTQRELRNPPSCAGPQMTAGRRELQAASTVTWLLSFVAALFFSVKIRNLTHVATTRDRRPGILLRICFGGGVLLHSTSWS